MHNHDLKSPPTSYLALIAKTNDFDNGWAMVGPCGRFALLFIGLGHGWAMSGNVGEREG